MLEQQLQTKILKFLDSKNIYAVKIVTANTAGHCDILACVNGLFIGIEVKAKITLKPKPLQLFVHKKIVRSGGKVFIVAPENYDQFLNQITSIINKGTSYDKLKN